MVFQENLEKVVISVIFVIFGIFAVLTNSCTLSRSKCLKVSKLTVLKGSISGVLKVVVFRQNGMLGPRLYPEEAWWATLSLSDTAGDHASGSTGPWYGWGVPG